MFEFIGILFLLLGILFLFIPYFRKDKVFIVPLILGLAITWLHTFGPLAGKRQKVRDVIAIDSTAIVEIKVLPNNTGHNDLVRADMVIDRQDIINKFCAGLNKGKVSWDQHQNPLWNCFVEILKKDRSTILLDVSKQGPTTLVMPMTKGIFKLYYGTIRADDVGFLLEELAPPHKK